MDDGVCIRTYDTNPKKTYPKQVAIAEGGTKVIGGGDDGLVHVFDRTSNELLQALRHSSTGRVQTIAVSEPIHESSKITNTHTKASTVGDAHLILAATSSNEKSISISMWKKQITFKNRERNEGLTVQSTLRSVLQSMTHLIGVIAVVILALQMTVRVKSLAM